MVTITKKVSFSVLFIGDFIKTTISIKKDELNQLRRYAEETGRTISGSVKRALEILYRNEGWVDAKQDTTVAENSR